jgi:galactose mutarotase-like enzyme
LREIRKQLESVSKDEKDEYNIELKKVGGIDHCFIVDTNNDVNNTAARVVCHSNGILMDVYTTEPGFCYYYYLYHHYTIINV